MTNNNIYDLPKTATIAYYDVEIDQNLTAEEWKQLHPITSSSEIKDSDSYVSEKAFSRDIAMYGPGFWDDVWKGAKVVSSVSLAISYYTPIGPITMGATAVVGTIGLAMNEFSDDPEVKRAGQEMLEIVGGAVDNREYGEGAVNAVRVYRTFH